MTSNNVFIENSRFIFDTNFSGDPRRDKYGSDARKGNIIIPDISLARELIDEGFNVKMTRPREGEEEDFTPTYYVMGKLSYRDRVGEPKRYPPRVIFVEDDYPTELTEETVGRIDHAWVDHVNVVLNKYESDRGKSLYIKTMEVFQKTDDDPILVRYARNRNANHDDSEDINFNPQSEEMPF
jgi:hypothetical protein